MGDMGEPRLVFDDITLGLLRKGLNKEHPFDYWAETAVVSRIMRVNDMNTIYNYRELLRDMTSNGVMDEVKKGELERKLNEFYIQKGKDI